MDLSSNALLMHTVSQSIVQSHVLLRVNQHFTQLQLHATELQNIVDQKLQSLLERVKIPARLRGCKIIYDLKLLVPDLIKMVTFDNFQSIIGKGNVSPDELLKRTDFHLNCYFSKHWEDILMPLMLSNVELYARQVNCDLAPLVMNADVYPSICSLVLYAVLQVVCDQFKLLQESLKLVVLPDNKFFEALRQHRPEFKEKDPQSLKQYSRWLDFQFSHAMNSVDLYLSRICNDCCAQRNTLVSLCHQYADLNDYVSKLERIVLQLVKNELGVNKPQQNLHTIEEQKVEENSAENTESLFLQAECTVKETPCCMEKHLS